MQQQTNTSSKSANNEPPPVITSAEEHDRHKRWQNSYESDWVTSRPTVPGVRRQETLY